MRAPPSSTLPWYADRHTNGFLSIRKAGVNRLFPWCAFYPRDVIIATLQVVDGPVITSRVPDDLPLFCRGARAPVYSRVNCVPNTFQPGRDPITGSRCIYFADSLLDFLCACSYHGTDDTLTEEQGGRSTANDWVFESSAIQRVRAADNSVQGKACRTVLLHTLSIDCNPLP